VPQGALRRAAIRLLHLLLPLCLLAAAGVAVQGLFRVERQPQAQPFSEQTPSLRLGGGPTGTAPLPAAAAVPGPSPTAPPARSPSAAARLTSAVVVVNASNVTGLAGRTAEELRRRGISVASIGNLTAYERPSSRTVFYPPGDRDQARLLATLADAPAVAPAPMWLAPGGRLVLVVTADTSLTS
jgi:hypothetical protein